VNQQVMSLTIAELQDLRTLVINENCYVAPISQECRTGERHIVTEDQATLAAAQLGGKVTVVDHVRARFEVHRSGSPVTTTKIDTDDAAFEATYNHLENYFLEVLPATA
jgi:hypothetical protein